MTKKSLTTTESTNAEEKFKIMFETYSQPVFRFLYWRTSDRHLAEDLTSGVFEKAWRSRDKFDGVSPQAWLYRIARNALTDYWRLKKNVPLKDEDSLQSQDSEIGDLLDANLQLDVLRGALKKLPAEMRTIIKLRFIEGLSAREVGTRLNISEGNVRVIQFRALKLLREHMS